MINNLLKPLKFVYAKKMKHDSSVRPTYSMKPNISSIFKSMRSNKDMLEDIILVWFR